jgi:hypothetical protein
MRELKIESLMDEKIVVDAGLQENMKTQPDPFARIEALLAELVSEIRKATNKRSRISDIDSPWLNSDEAAKYTGYSVESFRDLVKEYQIPRYGPARRQYCKDDLDEFMREPDCFKSTSEHRAKRCRTNMVHNSLLRTQLSRKGKSYI